ncbi:hypothetical protein SOCEGT47_009450 [Sorangium cellulosum]|uniref:DUF4276 domain-containing protein n=1 Tax=Sorangium cellulosum TaxID=56 RepID=A0A4P2PUW2_SORCE|nr:hypothetical protein [Sorangium cellulosum]AUX20474.1 hypothetical protein SOCEGT47_009450 [Sorangium cellulosum]
MSYRVLVIPEDFRKDQCVLEPIIAKMFEAIGREAKVIVCRDPLLGGVDQALRWERLQEILLRYQAMIECFLLVVDRDGKPGRREALDRLESLASAALPSGKRFLAENAWQEIEVWLLAGHDLPSNLRWSDVRAHENPKEAYYQPLARQRGVLDEPAEGRRVLAREAASRYSRIRSLCPEIADLQRRLGE